MCWLVHCLGHLKLNKLHFRLHKSLMWNFCFYTSWISSKALPRDPFVSESCPNKVTLYFTVQVNQKIQLLPALSSFYWSLCDCWKYSSFVFVLVNTWNRTENLSGRGPPACGTVVPRAEGCSSSIHQRVSPSSQQQHLLLAAEKVFSPSSTSPSCFSVLPDSQIHACWAILSLIPAWSCSYPESCTLYLVASDLLPLFLMPVLVSPFWLFLEPFTLLIHASLLFIYKTYYS